MIKKHTILILGAGASMDCGFPSGKQLMQDIINLLYDSIFFSSPELNNKLVALVLRRYYEQEAFPDTTLDYCISRVKRFSRALIEASPASIDDFLDKNREEQFDIIGKICIVLCISRYEKPGKSFFLAPCSSVHGGQWEIREGWYRHLWEKSI
jgi:hypothetical protein